MRGGRWGLRRRKGFGGLFRGGIVSQGPELESDYLTHDLLDWEKRRMQSRSVFYFLANVYYYKANPVERRLTQ